MRGVAVPGGFRLDAAASCRCLNPHPGHGLAASRRSVVAFRPSKGVSSHDTNYFGAQSHGLFTGCLRLATFLPALAVVRPPKARFQLVVNLSWVGLDTHRVPCEVSAFSTSHPPHPGFACRNA
jgi:hypothetical protein